MPQRPAFSPVRGSWGRTRVGLLPRLNYHDHEAVAPSRDSSRPISAATPTRASRVEQGSVRAWFRLFGSDLARDFGPALARRRGANVPERVSGPRITGGWPSRRGAGCPDSAGNLGSALVYKAKASGGRFAPQVGSPNGGSLGCLRLTDFAGREYEPCVVPRRTRGVGGGLLRKSTVIREAWGAVSTVRDVTHVEAAGARPTAMGGLKATAGARIRPSIVTVMGSTAFLKACRFAIFRECSFCLLYL